MTRSQGSPGDGGELQAREVDEPPEPNRERIGQRDRFRDLAGVVDRFPQVLGIGIDEATALVVRGSRAEVVGRGAAHFYDRENPVIDGHPDHETVSSGGAYDLRDREVVGP